MRWRYTHVPVRYPNNEIPDDLLTFMNQVASHCANRSREGLANTAFRDHPNELVRYAAELGTREGQACGGSCRL